MVGASFCVEHPLADGGELRFRINLLDSKVHYPGPKAMLL